MPGLIVKNAKLLDTLAAELRPGASLRIEENKIVEVAEDGRELAAGGDVVVLDAEGRTLMPGLIDAHVHPSITILDLTAMVRRQASWVAIETSSSSKACCVAASPPSVTRAAWMPASPTRSTAA